MITVHTSERAPARASSSDTAIDLAIPIRLDHSFISHPLSQLTAHDDCHFLLPWRGLGDCWGGGSRAADIFVFQFRTVIKVYNEPNLMIINFKFMLILTFFIHFFPIKMSLHR
ncbi:unnamed protein product, partial [Cuscuta europaea]